MIDKENIPKDWEIVPLGKVCKLKNGFAFKSTEYISEGIPVIRISDIKEGIIRSDKTVKVKASEKHNEYVIENNDILVAMSGATTGKFGIYKSEAKAYQNQRVGNFKILDKSILSNDFLLHQLHSLKRQIEKDAYGGAQPNISSIKIEEMLIALPPINIQDLIVSKIEELFSELDKGIADLKTAQQQLKVYRQSVLKAAFEGKLTNENIKEGEFPKKWRLVKIEDIATVGTGATPLKSNKKYYNGKIAWVTSGALNNEFVKEPSDWVTELALKETNLSIYPKHTLLLAMYGEGKTRGKCSELLFEATTNQAIAAIHFDKQDIRVRPFLKYFLLKNYNDIRMLSSGGVQPNLNLGIVKKTLLPLPPIEEQHLIIQEIESRLSVADKIEESISQSLEQAETLRQSILKKAFEGKLVIQHEQEAKEKTKVIALFPAIKENIKDTDLHAAVIAKIVLAHEASQKHRNKLTHIKCEKIAHLVEYQLGFSLGREPAKDAAGPDDYPHLKKVEHRANMANWFGIKKLPVGHTYQSKSGINKCIEKAEAVLSEKELAAIDQLIQTFLPFELEHAELIATIHAGWNNLLLSGKNPTDEEIVYESRENWSDRKLTIPRENFFKTLEWMKRNGFIPQGKGKLVNKKEEVVKVKPTTKRSSTKNKK